MQVLRRSFIIASTSLLCGWLSTGLVGWLLHGQERVTLATPITPTATITDYQVRSLHLELGDRTTVDDDNVVVVLEATTGTPTDPLHTQRFTYTGQIANNMITALNKANLSTRSLNQRILDRLVADGLIAGAVTGTVP